MAKQTSSGGRQHKEQREEGVQGTAFRDSRSYKEVVAHGGGFVKVGSRRGNDGSKPEETETIVIHGERCDRGKDSLA